MCSGCYTSRFTNFYRNAVVHFLKNSYLTGHVYAGHKTPKSNFFFYPIWLIAKKVILLEIMNTELTASTSSWTWQWMKVESDKPQTRHEPQSVSGFLENNLWARFHQGISLSQTVTIFYSSQKPDKSKLVWFYFQGKQGACLFFNTHYL